MDFKENTMKQKRNPLPCTAANSSSAASGKYDVFLSFRGVEIRKTFADFLFTNLVNAGIRTFRDGNELRAGEKIGPDLLKSIEESKISIPIFSKNYASSKWCLLELSEMVKCQREKGQKILPIFYDVEPYDVRHQTGSYENAFLKHKECFDEKTVQRWKEALREVGELKGWEVEKENNGHQGELVNMVVTEVLLELKKNYMVLNDNLVGMDHHVEEMMKLLDVDSNGVSIVGIHGMGGIGKTTIAKVIYNQLLERFECCCFLIDVREASLQNKGLVELQTRLVSKILKRKCPYIADDNDGINIIEDKVRGKKVLIVLDDVDKKSQFDKLVGKCDWFGSGSRIIVTTRDKEVLNQLNVGGTYEPPMMERDHSLQLFSRHAFRSDFPPKGYGFLSREIVSTAAGLPLALVLIGSQLTGKGKEEWEEALMKLKKIPEEQVQEKLIISYEALKDGQKQIFLDIACLFIGRDKKYPQYLWDACEFYPKRGINVLVLRSLVKIQDDGKFRMHDQLRDLGREIVRRENDKDPGERSRLWYPKEALDILERRMGTKKVEALILKQEELFGPPLRNEGFGQLPRLRFLRVVDAQLAGDFKHLLSELRWFEWHGGYFAPTRFHLKNLVVLDLSYCRITEDWEASSQMKLSETLKVLNLSHCFGLRRLPDLSTCATLEVLILTGCKELVQIDSIGNLEKLEEINASHCEYVKGEIPWSIGRLSSLRILALDDTPICSLPTSVCRLSRLQTLNLLGCEKLISWPVFPPSLTNLQLTTFSSHSNLVNLEELCNLVKIPRDIGKLSKLETLIMDHTDINSLPAEIGALSQLKKLEVKSCYELRYIVRLPSSLFALHLDYCPSLKRLPDLSNLKNLSKLKLDSCGKLKGIPGLKRLKSLSYLEVSRCGFVETSLDLSNLKSLKELRICFWKRLTEIRGLEELESLEVLVTERCRSLKLPDLSNLKNLKSSSISLKKLNPYISGYKSIDKLPDLSNTRKSKSAIPSAN